MKTKSKEQISDSSEESKLTLDEALSQPANKAIEAEVRLLARELRELRNMRNEAVKSIKERENVVKERLDELCGNDSGPHCGCITRSKDLYYLYSKSGFKIPDNEEEIPEWLGVTKYKMWSPWSDKRMDKENK